MPRLAALQGGLLAGTVTLETVLAKAGKKALERNLYFLLSHLSFTAERTRTFLLVLPSLSEAYSHFNQLHFPHCSLKKPVVPE